MTNCQVSKLSLYFALMYPKYVEFALLISDFMNSVERFAHVLFSYHCNILVTVVLKPTKYQFLQFLSILLTRKFR